MDVKIYFQRLEKQLVLENWHSGLTDIVYMEFSYSCCQNYLVFPFPGL